MTVPFSSIPGTLRTPFVAAEFDSSRAQQGPGLIQYRALIIGQKIAAGSAAANTLHRVSSADQVVALAGRGSMLHRQAKAWFRNNRATELWIGVLDDNGAGVVATGTITLTGPATAAGTIPLYIAGELVQLAVAKDATAATIGPLLAAAINANADLPVTAAAGGAGSEHIVTLTHRHKGAVGNDVDVRVNYQDGEALPAGIAVAVVAMASGATNPVLTTLIAALGDTWFHVIAHPYTDATSLAALEAELASRFSGLRMIDGVAFTSAVGTQAQLGVIGDSRNSPHNAILAQPGKNPLTPPCEYAAAVAAVVAFNGNTDPARPFQTLAVAGVKAPARADLFTLQERNLELYDGISTSRVGPSGEVQIERLVTTYQLNAAGSADTAYLDVNTMLTLQYLRWEFRNRIGLRYPRHKLADDGTRFGAGQAVVTPSIMKGEAVAWFKEMETLGLVEGIDQFKADLVVERNVADRNRLDILLPPDLINQLVVTATNVQFRL
jgi:phage tail sheath gpL-like